MTWLVAHADISRVAQSALGDNRHSFLATADYQRRERGSEQAAHRI
jgi:hypothetical protein